MSERVQLAVNGLGRIGVPLARQTIEDPDMQLVAVGNRSISAQDVSERLWSDSVHGRFTGHEVRSEDGSLYVDGLLLPTIDTTKLRADTWSGLTAGVLVVADCTGHYTARHDAQKHLDAGANLVVLSSPSADPAVTSIVRGVNDTETMLEQAAEDGVVAVSSCSTNCIAPIVKLFRDEFPVESAYAHITHAKTNSQPLVDGSGDKTSTRRSAESLIMAGSGSDVEVVRLLPGLLFDSDCVRTPVDDGSVARISVAIKGTVTKEDVLALFASVEQRPGLAGIIVSSHHDMYSRGIIGESASSIVDLKNIKALPRSDRTVVRVAAWFDNEWGYTNRVREVAKLVGAFVTTS